MRFPFRKNRPFLLNKQQQQQQQHQLNDNDSVSSSRDESPPPPRIQSSQPDLIIRVGEEGTTYNYFKVLMAHHSKHIDELLLNDPSLTELAFPDIQPGVWELMVSCLRPSNTITVTSAYLVFPFYTKYQFEEGLRICDQRIRAEMERTDDLPLQHDNNNKICSRDDREAFTKFLDARIRYLIDFADLLPQTREAGIAVLEAVLHDQLSRLFLTQQQFKSLLPLLLKEERLLEPVRLVLADVGITVPDIILAEEHDTVNTIYQLLKLQFKLDYARSQGCDFPDEEQQQQQPDEACSVTMTMVDDSDNFSTQHQSPPSAVILEDETKSGSYRMFKTPRPRLGSQTPSQRTFCIDDSDHS